MVSLKIECGCGQHYAFEVEPVMGRMPGPVTCPACGADGTATANEMISNMEVSPGVPMAPVAITAVPITPTFSRAESSRPGRHTLPLAAQPNKTQALFEARAKISWGDPPQEVLKYLIIQGFAYEEAAEAVREMSAERAAAIRQRGFVYMAGGVGMICVPILTWIGFLHAGYISTRRLRFLIVTIAVGLGGIGLLIKGIFMFVTPQSSSGDVAEQ
jgi:hypothetical protein